MSVDLIRFSQQTVEDKSYKTFTKQNPMSKRNSPRLTLPHQSDFVVRLSLKIIVDEFSIISLILLQKTGEIRVGTKTFLFFFTSSASNTTRTVS